MMISMLRIDSDKLRGTARIDPMPGLTAKLAELDEKIMDLADDYATNGKTSTVIKTVMARLDAEREHTIEQIESANTS
jgi:hypothetical protein